MLRMHIQPNRTHNSYILTELLRRLEKNSKIFSKIYIIFLNFHRRDIQNLNKKFIN